MSQNVDAICYVTPLQHGMLYHSQREPDSGIYVEQFSCLIVGPLHGKCFEAAWSDAVHRHDVLKTLFIRLRDASPMQVVRKQVSVPFEAIDWQGLSADQQEARFADLLRADRRKGFDLSRAPLVRFRLITVGPERHRFLWTFHHAILDGWSLPVVLDEVFRLYAAKVADRPVPLPNPLPYRNYVSWMRAQDNAKALRFWEDFLKGFTTPLKLAPSMAPQAGTKRESAASTRRLATVKTQMPKAWQEAALQACRTNQITLNTLCQGAWSLLLAMYGNQDDIVYGTVVSGRPAEIVGAERMAGLFICTLPFRARLARDAAVSDWLKQLQSSNLEIERYSYSALSEILNCSEIPRTQSLFDTLYVFENYPGQAQFEKLASACGLQVQDIRAIEETNYSLALVVVPQDGLRIQLTYDTAQFCTRAVERLSEQYRQLLERMLDLEHMKVGELHLGCTRLIANGAAVALPTLVESVGTINALIAQRANAWPEEPAFQNGDTDIRYRELSQLLDRYRDQWQRHGYVPGSKVLISIENPLLSVLVLLSGIACGIECVLLDKNAPLSALADATDAQGAPLVLAGCVSDETLENIPVRTTLFPRVDDVLREPEPGEVAPQSNPAGACLLISNDIYNGWEVLRYGEAAILSSMLWFSGAYPSLQAKCIPLQGSPLRHDNLWTTLFALGGGLTLHCFAECADDDFLGAVAAAHGPWHSVRLNHGQTRSLSYAAGRSGALTIPADYVAVDATAVTGGAVDALRTTAGHARLVKEFRWPLRSLPHAWSVYDEHTQSTGDFRHQLGQAVPGSSVLVVDRNLRPAGIDELGTVAIAGQSVPSGRFGDGKRTLVPSPFPHHDGSILLTGLCAWPSETEIHAELLSAETCLSATDARLSELEQELSVLPGLEGIALVERVAEDGAWERVAFYATGEQSGDGESMIRAVLAARQMTADAFVQVMRVPRSAGRTDHRALLRGDFEPVERDTYVAPRDEVEIGLQAIWQDLLKRPRIGINDNYFELGGQSLLATVMLHEIEQQLSAQVDIELFLEHPTIAGLADVIKGGVTTATQTDLRSEVELDEGIVPSTPFNPDTFQFRNVFLTGATGFLGVHLLADLLKTTSADVYCLVRAPDAPAGSARLVGTLQKYRLWEERYLSRLRAVPGELEKPLLGLDEKQFAALAESIDAIYHNGAQVNFVYPYSSLKQVNVLATEDILRLACRGKTKPVHYVSTVGVLDRTQDLIGEDLCVPWHPRLLGGYEQSKWVAEQIVCLAGARGLPVSIYRPSRIVGHSRTGRINTDDLFCRMIKGIIELGKAPYDAGFDNIVPVDVVSRVIVESSLRPLVYGRAVHVVNPVWNSVNAVVDCIEREGFPVERLDYNSWLLALEEHVKKHREHPLAMLIPVLKRLNPTIDPSISKVMPISHANATALLGEHALESMASIDGLLRVYFDYFYSAGYLSANVQQVATLS